MLNYGLSDTRKAMQSLLSTHGFALIPRTAQNLTHMSQNHGGSVEQCSRYFKVRGEKTKWEKKEQMQFFEED